MARALAWVAATVMAAGATGCAHGRGVNAPAAGTSAQAYRIGCGDVLEVDVWRDGDLTRTQPVRPDGKIALPLVGELQVEGRTPADVQAEVEQRLAGLVQSPRVAVIVREVNAAHFYAVGELEKPGVYPIRSSTTLLQALAMAGGPGAFAAKSEVVVVRADGRYTVDYDDLVSGKAGMVVEAGDTIYVP